MATLPRLPFGAGERPGDDGSGRFGEQPGQDAAGHRRFSRLVRTVSQPDGMSERFLGSIDVPRAHTLNAIKNPDARARLAPVRGIAQCQHCSALFAPPPVFPCATTKEHVVRFRR